MKDSLEDYLDFTCQMILSYTLLRYFRDFVRDQVALGIIDKIALEDQGSSPIWGPVTGFEIISEQNSPKESDFIIVEPLVTVIPKKPGRARPTNPIHKTMDGKIRRRQSLEQREEW